MSKKSISEELKPEEIKKMAKAEGLYLIEDRKFGMEGYVSVQCSWPELIRFARRIVRSRRNDDDDSPRGLPDQVS